MQWCVRHVLAGSSRSHQTRQGSLLHAKTVLRLIGGAKNIASGRQLIPSAHNRGQCSTTFIIALRFLSRRRTTCIEMPNKQMCWNAKVKKVGALFMVKLLIANAASDVYASKANGKAVPETVKPCSSLVFVISRHKSGCNPPIKRGIID